MNKLEMYEEIKSSWKQLQSNYKTIHEVIKSKKASILPLCDIQKHNIQIEEVAEMKTKWKTLKKWELELILENVINKLELSEQLLNKELNTIGNTKTQTNIVWFL